MHANRWVDGCVFVWMDEYVCACIWMCVCMYGYMDVCMDGCVYVCVWMDICVCYVCMDVCMDVYMCVYGWICVCVCVCVYQWMVGYLLDMTLGSGKVQDVHICACAFNTVTVISVQ